MPNAEGESHVKREACNVNIKGNATQLPRDHLSKQSPFGFRTSDLLPSASPLQPRGTTAVVCFGASCQPFICWRV
jgi:hypothetical protein